ncbi:SIR2 family protein [Halomonas sp. NO4]|uniref:SIR2 family protein n=1 Tax=Halomonas sp. NO4 TaxID=2484813 RepID=UPI0013D7DED3|nr:SIR2 family protein [Halomonas sp. NO4]
MKQAANRQQIDTLYVLGAGASYGLTKVKTKKHPYSRQVTPLDATFLKNLQHFQPANGWRRASTELVLQQWFDRIAAVDHGLEEAIIKRVSQYDFLSNLHPTKIKGRCNNAEYLNHLSHLITEFLSRCKANNSGNARKLIQHIFPAHKPVAEYTDRIITFNYDTVLERPLIDRGLSKKKIYFDRIVAREEDGIRRYADEKFPHPIMLKLHGSINWRCNKRHFEEMITGNIESDEKIVVWSDDKGRPTPDDDDSPLIIPPIPNKPITATSLFRFLWTLAYEYMHQAKRIVIVGYSCPPTDTLARTMFSQFTSRTLEEIFVVDPNAVALKNYREMLEPRTAARAKWRYYPDICAYIESELN